MDYNNLSMDYYDENGIKLSPEDLIYFENLTSAVSLSEDEIIEPFIKVESIYILLKDKGKKFTTTKIKSVNKKFAREKFKYEKMLSIWKEHQLNPFDNYTFSIMHLENEIKPQINIFPQNINQIEQYINFTSEWVNETLLTITDKPFKIHSKTHYLSEFDNLSKLTEEVINTEIDRVINHITLLVNELNLNPQLIDYSYCFDNLTIGIDFFKIKRLDRIKNIWSLALGRGILLGDYNYLSYLKRKKRDFTEENKYILKNNYSYSSEFSDLELENIYKKLVDKGYIEQMDSPIDFIKVFRETKISEIKPITWKKVKNRWLSILTLIELTVKPDYSNIEIFKDTFGFCFDFGKTTNMKESINKSITSRIKEISEYANLQDKIVKIVNSD